jgi:hypothetical protein
MKRRDIACPRCADGGRVGAIPYRAGYALRCAVCMLTRPLTTMKAGIL